jgi:tRNA-(ms[2]io[6]A)-hydroxylase
MLCLKTNTKPDWIQNAVSHLDDILIDHAHCEKKAAATAISFIARYPENNVLVKHMAALAQEEMEHFERIHRVVVERGVKFAKDKPDGYVNELLALVRKQEPHRFLDSLLVASLVEARSCERFTLLAKHISDDTLKELYKGLVASEAGHYTMFVDIAKRYFPHTTVKTRLRELAEAEKAIVLRLPSESRMHG